MNDREHRDTWSDPPRGSEGDAHKDFESKDEDERASETTHGKDRYAPRHRAAGRPPLIRRRRNREGESEEVTRDTSDTGPEEPARWSEQEDSTVAPSPPPVEDVPYLGPTRAEQRRTGGQQPVEDDRELVRRARDYTGRHLAPRRSRLWGREGSEATGEHEDQAEEPRVEGGAGPGSSEGHPAVEVAPISETTSPDLEPQPTRPAAPEVTPVAGADAGPPAEPAPKPEAPEREPVRGPGSGSQEPLLGSEASDDLGPAEDESPSGPRRAALQERKKKRRTRTAAGGLAALLLAVAGVAGAGLVVKRVVDPPKERVAVPLPPPEEELIGGTTLVFGTKESGRGAVWMTLLSLDAETGEGSVVYIPPHTAVEVPGRGLQGVGEAYGSGGIPLLLVSVENLLGVKIDRYLELSDKDALVFFDNLQVLTVDVPAEVRVPAGKDQARLIFVEGPQELSPGLLVKLLYIVGIDGDDIELGSRHLAFWDELLNAYDEGAELTGAVREAGAALRESDASPEEHGAFFAALADLPSEDLTITALPVRPISAGESELYATDAQELVAFVEDTIGVDQERPQEIRIQVLNGNGVPGIGQEVADELVGEGFRVILSGNARRLNYRKTLIIAYDSSDEGVALAERARGLLGVGEVQVSAQQQGIVDLTIVVGKDFLRAR